MKIEEELVVWLDTRVAAHLKCFKTFKAQGEMRKAKKIILRI